MKNFLHFGGSKINTLRLLFFYKNVSENNFELDIKDLYYNITYTQFFSFFFNIYHISFLFIIQDTST